MISRNNDNRTEILLLEAKLKRISFENTSRFFSSGGDVFIKLSTTGAILIHKLNPIV